MPNVRLRVADAGHPDTAANRQYLDPPPTVRETPVLRLVTRLTLEGNPRSRRRPPRQSAEALLDTGMWVSVVEYPVWERYERAGLLERLEHPVHGLSPDTGATTRIVGARSGYVFGKMWVRVSDADDPDHELPVVPVVAQLLLSPAVRLPVPIILGLHLGVLDGRKLVREPVMGHDDPVESADCGRRYGQVWRLETA